MTSLDRCRVLNCRCLSLLFPECVILLVETCLSSNVIGVRQTILLKWRLLCLMVRLPWLILPNFSDLHTRWVCRPNDYIPSATAPVLSRLVVSPTLSPTVRSLHLRPRQHGLTRTVTAVPWLGLA